VIESWGGLGYQRRALDLRRASRMITDEGWPTTSAGLRQLPGVGPYTAAAVACFAFGEPVAAIDTNLRRVVSRWLGRVPTAAELEASANEMIDRDDPAGWNQAIMDLGALRCRPKAPRCDGCPVAAWCLDPSVYEAPPRQSRYEGSTRQARAAVLRAIATHGPAAVGALAGHTSLPLERVEAAIGSLLADGTVARRHHEVIITDEADFHR
jgi:A/G-specific adenine glycosylase